MKKILYIAIVLMMVLTSLSYASVGMKEETLHYMGIQISIDGKTIIPTDVNQNVVNPFIIDGTTFLPVRAFSEAFGKEVKWVGETSSIYITDASGESAQKTYSGEVSRYTADVVKTISYEDVKIYIGNFKNDKYEGKGVRSFPNGEKYDGYFHEGYMEGKGTRFYIDKSKNLEFMELFFYFFITIIIMPIYLPMISCFCYFNTLTLIFKKSIFNMGNRFYLHYP